MSYTLWQLKADILRHLGPRENSIFKRLTQPLTTTSTSASAASIVDTSLVRGTADTTDFHRCQIEIIETVGAGPTVDTSGAVSGATQTGLVVATGVLSVNPNFGATPQSATRYLMYPPNVSPEALRDSIKEVCRSTYAPGIYFPSLVDDADFDLDTAAAATYWSDAVGTPTQTFETTAALTLFGERSLKVATTSSGDGVHNANAISVTENEVLELSVHVACPTGSVTVQLYDVTNSAVIDSVIGIDEPAFTTVHFVATVPADCEQVRIRFLSATATTTFYVSAGVVLQSQSERFYKAPTWLEDESQIYAAIRLPHGYASEVNESYRALTGGMYAERRPDVLRFDRGTNPLLLGVCGAGYGIYALEVSRPFAEVSTNAGTLVIDREYAKWKAIAVVLRTHGDEEWEIYNHTAARIARIKRYGERKMFIGQPREVAV